MSSTGSNTPCDIVRVSELGRRGEGLTLVGDKRVFIPFALPGERLIVSAEGERRQIREVLQGSADRVQPYCAYFGTCGGCALQHYAEPAYRAWKRQLLVSALSREGIEADVADLVDAHGAGRRRATLHGRRYRAGAGPVVGFTRARAHEVINIETCPVLDPRLAPVLGIARAIADAIVTAERTLDLLCTASDDGLDIDLRGCGPLEQDTVERLIAIASRSGVARISNHGTILIENAQPSVSFGDVHVALPSGAFLQPTAMGEQVLSEAVCAAAVGAAKVVDLFSGIGTFALRLAKQCEVQAFDLVPASIAAVEKAARRAADVRAVKASARDLFRRPLLPDELNAFDAVCLDPPRVGAEEQMRMIAASTVTRVISVSCDAITFARDAAILLAAGFTIDRPILPVDQFRHTPHLEIVGVFRRPPARRKKRLLG